MLAVLLLLFGECLERICRIFRGVKRSLEEVSEVVNTFLWVFCNYQLGYILLDLCYFLVVVGLKLGFLPKETRALNMSSTNKNRKGESGSPC